jgi:hypothetical protein
VPDEVPSESSEPAVVSLGSCGQDVVLSHHPLPSPVVPLVASVDSVVVSGDTVVVSGDTVVVSGGSVVVRVVELEPVTVSVVVVPVVSVSVVACPPGQAQSITIDADRGSFQPTLNEKDKYIGGEYVTRHEAATIPRSMVAASRAPRRADVREAQGRAVRPDGDLFRFRITEPALERGIAPELPARARPMLRDRYATRTSRGSAPRPRGPVHDAARPMDARQRRAHPASGVESGPSDRSTPAQAETGSPRAASPVRRP